MVRLASVAVALQLGVLLVGCTGDGSTPSAGTGASPAPTPAPELDLGLSFIQQRVFEGTNRAQVRVVNTSGEDLRVTGVGLDWPGYGGRFLQEKDYALGAGATIDFSVELPVAECPDQLPRALALVQVADHGLVTGPIDGTGQRYLEVVHHRACDELEVSTAVDITYADRWRLDPTPTGRTGRPTLTGSVRLTRRDGDEPVTVAGVDGSVIYGLDVGSDPTLPSGERAHDVALRVSVLRCDEHARAESQQTFVFKYVVRIGSDEPLVIRVPPQGVQGQFDDFWERACGA